MGCKKGKFCALLLRWMMWVVCYYNRDRWDFDGYVRARRSERGWGGITSNMLRVLRELRSGR